MKRRHGYPLAKAGTLDAGEIGIAVKLADLWKGLKKKHGDRL